MLSTIRTKLYMITTGMRRVYLRRVWGMTIGKKVRISSKAHLDLTHPEGIHIGDYSIITPGVRIFTHDFVHAVHDKTQIGKCCFIGANAIITAGVRIGDHCIIAAGTVVNGHVPDRCMVAGNPPRIVRQGLVTGHFGRTVSWADGRIEDEQELSDGTVTDQPLDDAEQHRLTPRKRDHSNNG